MILLLFACAQDRALLGIPAQLQPHTAVVEPAPGVVLTLEEAAVAAAALTLSAPTATATRRWPRAAWAHPGHEQAGTLYGELLGPWTLDLLAGQDLGDAAVYAGDYAEAQLTLSPTPAATLRGTATVDGVARPFALELAPEQRVSGLPFAYTLSAEAPWAGLTLEVDLAHALSFIDWRAPDADGDGVLTAADGTTRSTALFGLQSTPTWTLQPEE